MRLTRDKKSLQPDIVAACVSDAIQRIDALDRKITKLFADLDGTLSPVASYWYDPLAIESLRSWCKRSPEHEVCVFSNIGTPLLFPRLKSFANMISAGYYGGWFMTPMKPSPTSFEIAMGKIGACPDNSAMIGDTIAKDVLGANWAGMISALVPTMEPIPWWKDLLMNKERNLLQELEIVFPPRPQLLELVRL